jgi:hypothetical protein
LRTSTTVLLILLIFAGMELAQRISSFASLGSLISGALGNVHGRAEERIRSAMRQAELENPWFTQPNILHALAAIARNLTKENLQEWVNRYTGHDLEPRNPITVGVVMAGNIPLVGFHDMLCVLISGNRLLAKISSKDSALVQAVTDALIMTDPHWKDRIMLSSGQLSGFDAVIATGSNNTSRYFEYYFGKYRNIIRRNRNSIGIITGTETREDLQGLADDILLYFGLGCRSVSKLFLPAGYGLSGLSGMFEKYSEYRFHNKYQNNYTYYKSIFIVNNTPFLDDGLVIMTESTYLSSPVSVLYYEFYNDREDLMRKLQAIEGEVQCVVSNTPWKSDWIRPGMAQNPGLDSYADNINTLDFLTSAMNRKN